MTTEAITLWRNEQLRALVAAKSAPAPWWGWRSVGVFAYWKDAEREAICLGAGRGWSFTSLDRFSPDHRQHVPGWRDTDRQGVEP